VIDTATAVEDDLGDALVQGTLADDLADRLRGGDVAAELDRGLDLWA
jgi:hypothetical protein